MMYFMSGKLVGIASCSSKVLWMLASFCSIPLCEGADKVGLRGDGVRGEGEWCREIAHRAVEDRVPLAGGAGCLAPWCEKRGDGQQR